MRRARPPVPATAILCSVKGALAVVYAPAMLSLKRTIIDMSVESCFALRLEASDRLLVPIADAGGCCVV